MEGVTLSDLKLPSKSFPHLKERMVNEAMSEVEREEMESMEVWAASSWKLPYICILLH